jgi:putative transposase
VKDFRDWPHSSYHTLLSKSATKLQRDETLKWFGGKENFIEAHKKDVIEPWLLDQDFD